MIREGIESLIWDCKGWNFVIVYGYYIEGMGWGLVKDFILVDFLL